MNQNVIIITGAAGFLGSAIAVHLSHGHQVVALDRRQPSAALLDATPNTTWHQVDIADAGGLASVFAQTEDSLGRIDFVVHLAAFYHFGIDWRREYERTNLQGTANVLHCAAENGVRRVIFASSVAAMRPLPKGECLKEKTPTTDYIPYAKSKALGEKMVREASDRLPGIVLRIGGAFSDWAELPPLAGLIRLWAGPTAMHRLVVGQGMTGIPYIHREDIVRIVRCCIDTHERLDRYEVFLACQQGTVLHRDLFSAIRRITGRAARCKPVYLSPAIAKLGLRLKLTFGYLLRDMPYERLWMLEYVDRPWVADTTYTQHTLGWSCTERMGVLDRLPRMLAHFRQDRRKWRYRNRMRNRGLYDYHAPEAQ